MKLTKTQADLMDSLNAEIRNARECETFEDYFSKYIAHRVNTAFNTPEKYKAGNMEGWNWWKTVWEQKKNGVVCTITNSRTIKALENLGLIEIVKDGGASPDIVRVIEA